MSTKDFVTALKTADDLEVLGCKDNSIAIRCPANGLVSILDLASVAEHTWHRLWSVCTGRQSPKAMKHYRRVVGYYSEESNVNRSKLAEFRDRAKGNYAVPEVS